MDDDILYILPYYDVHDDILYCTDDDLHDDVVVDYYYWSPHRHHSSLLYYMVNKSMQRPRQLQYLLVMVMK